MAFDDSIFDIVMIFAIMMMLATIFGIDRLTLIGTTLLALVACTIWVFAKDWLVNKGIEL